METKVKLHKELAEEKRVSLYRRTKLDLISGKLKAYKETNSNPFTLIRDIENIMKDNL